MKPIRVLVIVQVTACPALTWTPLRLVPLPADPSEHAIWVKYAASVVFAPAVSDTVWSPAGTVICPVVPLLPTLDASVVPSIWRLNLPGSDDGTRCFVT